MTSTSRIAAIALGATAFLAVGSSAFAAPAAPAARHCDEDPYDEDAD
jgi:hypothetical protein